MKGGPQGPDLFSQPCELSRGRARLGIDGRCSPMPGLPNRPARCPCQTQRDRDAADCRIPVPVCWLIDDGPGGSSSNALGLGYVGSVDVAVCVVSLVVVVALVVVVVVVVLVVVVSVAPWQMWLRLSQRPARLV